LTCSPPRLALVDAIAQDMPIWPKSFLSFGASLLTARAAARLRKSVDPTATQDAIFSQLVGRLARTSHWSAAGITGDMSYAAFRQAVPPSTYEDLAEPIRRMVEGEADVLWPGRCDLYAWSSGTASGTPKTIPVPAEMLRHFQDGCRDALLHYTARVGHAGVFRGRHLFLTGSTALKPIREDGSQSAYAGEWPAIAALNLPAWASTHLFEPGAEIAEMQDWPGKVEKIIARTAERDITLLAGAPSWVCAFAETLRMKHTAPGGTALPLQTLWPNLECFVHGGLPIGPYHAELRQALGPNVEFHEVYAAAEGFLAAQDSAAPGQLRVFDRHGVFFEYIPLADFDPRRPKAAGSKAVPLKEVQANVDYVVLLTSPNGLVRYIVGDIVRFSSTRPPRCTYAGRCDLLLNAFDEHVIERDVTDVLVSVCQRHRWSTVNFHIAPLFGVSLTGVSRGRHEWWIELRPGTVETPTGPQMAIELDFELQRTNATYAARRNSGRIDAPFVRLVMPGVFRHWLSFHHRLGGQHKVARCRSDRLIADELAQITKFARD
jgi:hypothetical protein